jgi:protein TonB
MTNNVKGAFVRSARACACFLLASLLLGSACSGLETDKEEQASQILAQARSLQNIRSEEGKPYHLSARIHAQHIVAKPMDGSYEETWISSGKWRRQITVADFGQVEIGDQDFKWVSRNLDFQPRIAYLTNVAFDNFVRPEPLPEEKIVALQTGKKKRGVDVRCAQLAVSERSARRELCFDSSSALINEEYQNLRFEYQGFMKFGDYVVPRDIRVYEAGTEILTISVDEPSATAAPREEPFNHTAEATKMSACMRWPVEAVKKEPPHYPEEARRMQQEGTVVLYALLSPDGQVQRLKVLESAGKSLDQSALQAVRQWRYATVRCGTTPLPFETEIRVNYSLSNR